MDMSALAGMMGGGGLPAGLDGMMNNPAMKEAMAKVRVAGTQQPNDSCTLQSILHPECALMHAYTHAFIYYMYIRNL